MKRRTTKAARKFNAISARARVGTIQAMDKMLDGRARRAAITVFDAHVRTTDLHARFDMRGQPGAYRLAADCLDAYMDARSK